MAMCVKTGEFINSGNDFVCCCKFSVVYRFTYCFLCVELQNVFITSILHLMMANKRCLVDYELDWLLPTSIILKIFLL